MKIHFPLENDVFLGEAAINRTRLHGLTTAISIDYRFNEDWELSGNILWQDTDIDGFKN